MNFAVKGIISPLVTPLLDNDKIDAAGLEKLIDYQVDGGVHGLFILGTTGESASLSQKSRKEMIKRTADCVKKRLPVYAGITDTHFNGSLRMADYSAEAGIDALVIAPPYYLPLSQDEFREYLDNLVPKLPLPFLIYNIPSCTKLRMSAATIRYAKDLGSIGIKDSSGDISFIRQLTAEFCAEPDFAIITGTELHIPETISYGGHGAVAGGANIFPRLFVELYDACLSFDQDRIDSFMEKLKLIDDLIYGHGNYDSKYIKGIKCSLAALGICNDYVAMPFRRYNGEFKSRIASSVKKLEQSFL